MSSQKSAVTSNGRSSSKTKVTSPGSETLEDAEKLVASANTTRAKSMYFGQYVSHEGSKNLQTYQYRGCDNSLIYKHVLTPMNVYLITLIPMWLAPNLITLSGLICVVMGHVIIMQYSPLFEEEAPSWVYLLTALTLFVYQTLDNLDGKQARRTGTSSPLGLLFDHGCDAINITISCCTLSSVLLFGPGWKCLLIFITGNIAFTFATWEEYYTGALELPIINGPTEGILVGVMVKLLSAILGPQFWLQETIPGLQNNTVFLIFSTVTCVFTVLSNVFHVVASVRKSKESLAVAFTRLLPFLVLNLLAAVWGILSPSDILRLHPRLFLWTLGLLNSKLVLHLMIAHLCDEEYHPFRKTLVPIFFVAAHCFFSINQGIYPTVDEALVLKEFFFISLTAYVHIVVSVIIEVKTVLNIPVFTVGGQETNKNK